jgi:large subunit ribosomal protein L5
VHFLEKYYNNTLKHELINKFIYNDNKKIPKLKKIILNFGCKTADMKQLSSSLLAFELIVSQKGKLTRTKHSNILFKIRKGNPTGCTVILSKFNVFHFFSKMNVEIFPKLKTFSIFNNSKKLKVNTFSYKLKETFCFNELENYYYFFNNLPTLDVTIVTSSKTKLEMIFLLKSLKLPMSSSN